MPNPTKHLAENIGSPVGNVVWEKSDMFLDPGVVGVTERYTTPLSELGKPAINQPRSMIPHSAVPFPTLDNFY